MPPMLVPSVTADPSRTPDLQAPAVAPARNAAPQQIGQLGEALTRAGSAAFVTGQTIGDKVQETVDDANVRSAETSFLQNAQGVVTDYTHKLGKDAMDAYPDATQALSKAKQDAMGTLTNDIQRRMFGYVSTNHLLTFGRQMGDHNFQQTTTYGVKEHNDSADAQMQLAANNSSDWQRTDGEFAKYKMNGLNEVQAALHMSGIAPDSDQARAAMQQKTSALADRVLTQLTGEEHYDEAKAYYDAAISAGEIDDQIAKKWNVAITEGHSAEKGKNAGQQAIQTAMGGSADQQRTQPVAGASIVSAATPSGGPGGPQPVPGRITDVMGAPRPGGREHKGIDIAVPAGTEIKAPADGTVTKVWNDDKFGGGLSMEVTYPNGYVEGFAHLSAQNYKEGQKVTQGATLGLTGQTGNATGPVLHWAMKDPDGNFVDPRGVSPAPKDPLTFTDPDQLETALTNVRANTNLTERQKSVAEAYVERQYSIATSLKQAKYEEAKKAAVNLYYQQDGSIAGLPAEVKSQLTAEDIYKLNQPIPRKDDENTVLDLIAHPEKVVPGEIEKYRMDLSQETYQRFFAQAQKNAAPDSPNVLDASLDHNQLNTILAKNNFANLVDPKANTPEAQRKIDLTSNIQDQIDAEQTRLDRKLSRSEKETLMNQTIMDTTFIHHTFGRDVAVPRVTLTPDQAAKAYVNVGGQRVKLASIPAEDQKMIADAWTETEKEHGWTHRELSGEEIATKWLQLRQAGKAPQAAPARRPSLLPPF